MIQHARRPIETNNHGNNQERRRDNANGIFIRQPDRDDRGGELPRRGVEGVAEPVGDESVYRPFAVGATDGI